jgi:chaperonin GroES
LRASPKGSTAGRLSPDEESFAPSQQWNVATDFRPAERERTITEEAEMATLRPLHDRVIVRRITDSESTTAGGLVIPDTAKEKPLEGVVVAVGKGKVLETGDRVEPEVKEGDRVLFGKYAGSEVKLDGEELLIMREDDILGIVERAAKSASRTTK